MARCVIALLLLVSVPCFSASKKIKASSTQAASYAAQAIAALTGGNSISDVTLTGTATWTSGSDTENGNATLLALGTNESRMDLAFSIGTRTEIRDAQTGAKLGQWIAPDTSSGMFVLHNCQTDAVWFFPALSSLSGGSAVLLTYVGSETRNGESVQHLQSYLVQPSVSSLAASFQQLSEVDFYLDATTFLPSAITFNAHPDNNAASNLIVEIDFSNYQNINGITVPMHVQKYLQGTLLIDLTISSAVFNSGISLSTFSIN